MVNLVILISSSFNKHAQLDDDVEQLLRIIIKLGMLLNHTKNALLIRN